MAIEEFSPCDLHIPHKDWSGDDNERQNYSEIERWATYFHNNCLPSGGGGMTVTESRYHYNGAVADPGRNVSQAIVWDLHPGPLGFGTAVHTTGLHNTVLTVDKPGLVLITGWAHIEFSANTTFGDSLWVTISGGGSAAGGGFGAYPQLDHDDYRLAGRINWVPLAGSAIFTAGAVPASIQCSVVYLTATANPYYASSGQGFDCNILVSHVQFS